jgi:hypothetical protein
MNTHVKNLIDFFEKISLNKSIDSATIVSGEMGLIAKVVDLEKISMVKTMLSKDSILDYLTGVKFSINKISNVLSFLKGFDGNVDFNVVDETALSISDGKRNILINLIDESFVENNLPREPQIEFKPSFEVETSIFNNVLGMLSNFEKGMTIKLIVKDKVLTLSLKGSFYKFEESISFEGDDCEVELSCDKLNDVFRTLKTKTIHLSLTDKTMPVKFESKTDAVSTKIIVAPIIKE